MKRFLSSQLLLVFAFALVLRLAWFFVVFFKNPQGFMLYDSWGYWRISENLDLHRIFSQGEGNTLFPDFMRTPLYPFLLFFLKKIFFGYYGILLFQILLSAATCTLLAFIAEYLFNKKRTGFFAGILLCFDFPSIFFANTIMTETLFSFLLVVAFLFFGLFLKTRQNIFCFWSAIFLGLSILCRPVAMYLPFVFFGSFFLIENEGNFSKFYKRRPIKPALIFLVISYLIISPWIIRNYILSGKVFFSSGPDITLLFYTAATIKAEKENKSLFQVQSEYKEISENNFDWKQPQEAVRFSRYCREEAVGIIKGDPALFLKNHTRSFFYFFIKPLRNYIDLQLGNSNAYESITGSDQAFNSLFGRMVHNTSLFSLVLVFFQMILIFISVLFSFVFIFSGIKNMNPSLKLAMLIILYFAFLSGITEVDARMRVPAIPFIAMISAAGLSYIMVRVKNKIK